MNSIKTITFGSDRVHPVPHSRTSIKVSRQASLNDSDDLNSSLSSSSSKDNHYINIENTHHNSTRSKPSRTNINIESGSYQKASHKKQTTRVQDIKQQVEGCNQETGCTDSNSEKLNQEDEDYTFNYNEDDINMSTLLDEYQASLNRKGCDKTGCHRFKLLSYRLSQTLLDRLNATNTLRNRNKKDAICSESDRDSLLGMMRDKDKRIEDLERLLEEQKRLRLQDANQVEEKAARIKEWVANKLKELENQNKQLRDNNKKQKQHVESLSIKLALMSPVSSPRKVNQKSQELDRFNDETTNQIGLLHPKTLNLNSNTHSHYETKIVNALNSSQKPKANDSGLDCPSKPNNKDTAAYRSESPVYDSVSVEHITRRPPRDKCAELEADKPPPPPPPHQHIMDDWEHQLYDLAEKSLNQLLRQTHKEADSATSQKGPVEQQSLDKSQINSRRDSSSSMKNDLISLVKPSFTTIDGDQVVEEAELNDADSLEPRNEPHNQSSSVDLRLPPTQPFQNPTHSQAIRPDDQQVQPMQPIKELNRMRRGSHMNSSDIIERQPSVTDLFNSPRRTRTGQADSILRTQSVKRNPAPGILYDFVTADLVKRGYLVKPGALKNNNRWFVLKDFHLYSYKCGSDETTKSTPNMKLKLERECQVCAVNQSSGSSFGFKLIFPDKTLQLIAESAQARDEWIKILTVAINLSDIDPAALAKNDSTHEGLMSFTQLGHTKRCYATLTNHMLFFLKSPTDPTPLSYVSVKGARIKEITDKFDYDLEEQAIIRQKSCFQDCSLAIYPKFSLSSDPIYITLGSQQDIDKWFYHLSAASGYDQSCGTQFERALIRIMLNQSMTGKKNSHSSAMTHSSESYASCLWKNSSVMLYSDQPIEQPLTSLPNETLRMEALELFKSILLFTQVPLEPIAIDYHVSLLQNCLSRLHKHPELRNEFYAQLIKQGTYVFHRCSGFSSTSGSTCADGGGSSSTSSSGCSPTRRSSIDSLARHSTDCQMITDIQALDSLTNRETRLRLDYDKSSISLSHIDNQNKDTNGNNPQLAQPSHPPTTSELLQVMQILSIAVSLNLPRGRIRWWLTDHLNRFANPDNNIGKYALYCLRAMDRTLSNGSRENIPSRTEIMSVLLRNPYDHSSPHSLPLSFPDGSYMVIGADGSTTVEEFMRSMAKSNNIRDSSLSDFYLFADDPSDTNKLHILEPQRKILDTVGWWEQTLRRHNSGRYQNTRLIKVVCKKRLVFRAEKGETHQERLMIVHQINQEVAAHKIPLDMDLCIELAAIMAQLTFGNFDKSNDPKLLRCRLDKISNAFLGKSELLSECETSKDHLLTRWKSLSEKSPQECVRVYLNCIRRLMIDEQSKRSINADKYISSSQ